MGRGDLLHPVGIALMAVVLATAAGAQTIEGDGSQRAAIEALVDDWSAEHCAGEDGRPYRLNAPGVIDISPGYEHIDTGSAALGPRRYVSLAATAPLFRYEVSRIRADARFARVWVRERGYFYAGAALTTYERMHDASLVLERQDDGRWLVLAHRSRPLPDLGPDAPRPKPEPRCARFRPGEFGEARAG